jgi:CRISPR-associated endoribonuclease Cas6
VLSEWAEIFMRVLVEITTSATELPWNKVIGPGRGLAYNLLDRTAPSLGTVLHNDGWGVHRMVPLGHGAPVFPHAARRKGVYAAGGPGLIEFGSPLGYVIEALAEALCRDKIISWGGIDMRVVKVGLLEPPAYDEGVARMRTLTPVVIKGPSGVHAGHRQGWVLPNEPTYAEHFERNLVRKAETLGLTPRVRLDRVISAGPQRSFSVGKGTKPGATVEVDLSGDPEILRALWSWGLGQANSAGFGWIDAIA